MIGRAHLHLARLHFPAARKGRSLRLPSARHAAWACTAIFALSEAVVFLWLSRVVGVSLVLSSAGLVIIFRQQLHERVRAAGTRSYADPQEDTDASHDPETRLPNRLLLIEQLSRDIARAQRHAHELTLAVVEISRFEEFRASWGVEMSRTAAVHVADTLRRVVRSSDFVARLDAARFAVLLSPCDNAGAVSFGERLSLAVSNRPLRSTTTVRVPLYVCVDVSAMQYRSDCFRGPLDFLSAAGGDLIAEDMPRAGRPGGQQRAPNEALSLAADPQALRRQLVRDYYPDGQVTEFADAYREHRNRGRRIV